MSQSVVLIAPRTIELSDLLAAVASAGGGQPTFVDHSRQEAQFGGGGGAWYLTVGRFSSEYDDIIEYEEWENAPDDLRGRLDEMAYWSVVYNSMPHARVFLRSLFEGVDSPDDWWVDNDYGVVVRGRDLLNLLVDDVHWDWRKIEGCC